MVMYRTSQQQMNDILSFGMSIMFMAVIFGMVRSLVISTMKPERKYLPMTEAKKPPVTVTCPICGKEIDVPEYNSMTRTEALRRHIEREHSSRTSLCKTSNELLPQVMIEGGEKIPTEYRYLSSWLEGVLPDYSLLTLLPAVEPEVKERKIDVVLKQLKDGVESIQESDKFRLFLSTMAKFHDYSIGNLILIMIQKPDASHAAGFNTWKDLGRWVKSGEKVSRF